MKGGNYMIKNAVYAMSGTDLVCPVASETSMDYNYNRVVEAYSIYLKLSKIITKNSNIIIGKFDINSFQRKPISITC